jgi:hypothetical protein
MDTRSLQRIRHVALDMDGTLYKGDTVFSSTPGFLKRLAELGIGHTFLTNNSSRSVDDYVRHLRHMGIHATADQIHTSTLSTIDYLRRSYTEVRCLYVLGTPSLRAEFARAGFVITTAGELTGSKHEVTGGTGAADGGASRCRRTRGGRGLSVGHGFVTAGAFRPGSDGTRATQPCHPAGAPASTDADACLPQGVRDATACLALTRHCNFLNR